MTILRMDNSSCIPSVEKYYAGKSVLITGATGFVGKVLLSKLLVSCPLISEILLLIRPLKKADSSTRLATLLESSVFNKVREHPDAFSKIRVISGDVASLNLGLSDVDLKKVVDETSLVFHCAANVRFQDKPRDILSINLLGVQNVMEVCRNMTRLEALVHVSTAYSFCNQPIISEEVFSEKIRPRYIIEGLRWMTDGQLSDLCDHLVKNRPSLYHFSKAMAEVLISESRGNLPIIIVRPSIVTASLRDPFPGWIDNINGPSGFIALSSKGILRTLLLKHDVHADWVPVDMVVNTLIQAAHFMALQRFPENSAHFSTDSLCNPTSGLPVLNCVCPETNLITWSKVVDLCIPLLSKYPSLDLIRPPAGVVTSSETLHTLLKYVSHYIPASMVDFVMLLLWKNSRMVRSYQRIHGAMNHLQLYSTHKFVFTTTNMRQLIQMYSGSNNVFPIDQSTLVWPEYIDSYVHGVRRYCLKEEDDTLPLAKRKLTKLRIIWVGGEILLIGLLVICLTQRCHKSSVKSLLPALVTSKICRKINLILGSWISKIWAL